MGGGGLARWLYKITSFASVINLRNGKAVSLLKRHSLSLKRFKVSLLQGCLDPLSSYGFPF